MAKRRNPKSSQGGPKGGVRVRLSQEPGAWELVHPRCVRERAEDMEEVHAMLEAGETDIAIDELRWLLSGCGEFIEAHRLLGELAISEDNDLRLARGHFGIAFKLGIEAFRREGFPGTLPYRLPANAAFHEAGKGLAHCLVNLDKREMARTVVEQLLRCDPSDPLAVAKLL